jgi:hypothetical protein
MAHSSILGADIAPSQPSGRGSDVLGPSDSSDTGSDAMGTDELHEDSDAAGTGERGSATPGEGRESGDILPDRVKRLPEGEDLLEDPDGQDFTDLDAETSAEDEANES